MKYLLIIIISISFLFSNLISYSANDIVEGLDYSLRRIDNAPLDKNVVKNYDLYEIYFENKSKSTFSIPGYSIDLGVDYSSVAEINSLYKDKNSKRSAILNIATGAAAIALGGIARTAANSAIRVGSLRKKNINYTENDFLTPSKTYILYPDYAISIFLLVNKHLEQYPYTIRFVCRQEDSNQNFVVINNNFKLVVVDSRKSEKTNIENTEKENPQSKNIIANPDSVQYK